VIVNLSRRTFLGVAAAATSFARDPRTAPRCLILDLGCILPESLAGFHRQAATSPYPNSNIVIVPGAVSGARPAIQPFLDQGATVLVEYALGFEHPQQRIQQSSYFPYIEYEWPMRAMIREFHAAPLQPAAGDQVIATLGQQPVALRRRVGPGTLITLSSPLGPVLLAGDPDADRWLGALLLTSPARQ
jgi:hypothetical protein